MPLVSWRALIWRRLPLIKTWVFGCWQRKRTTLEEATSHEGSWVLCSWKTLWHSFFLTFPYHVTLLPAMEASFREILAAAPSLWHSFYLTFPYQVTLLPTMEASIRGDACSTSVGQTLVHHWPGCKCEYAVPLNNPSWECHSGLKSYWEWLPKPLLKGLTKALRRR